MSSSLFNELKKELEQLREDLLPSEFDPLGNYDTSVRTLARAYLLLGHAALETYFESFAKRILRRSEEIYDREERITRPIACILAFAEEPAIITPQTALNHRLELTKFIKSRLSEFYKAIKENNGIKEVNILKMFVPLGPPKSIFSGLLLTTLNSCGTDRGAHAHRSSLTVGNVIDPKTEHDRIVDLLTEIEAFDKGLTNYLNKVR